MACIQNGFYPLLVAFCPAYRVFINLVTFLLACFDNFFRPFSLILKRKLSLLANSKEMIKNLRPNVKRTGKLEQSAVISSSTIAYIH